MKLATILLAAFVLCSACSPAWPTVPTRSTATIEPTFVISATPLPGALRTFVFQRELAPPALAYTRASKFILSDTGAFALDLAGRGESRGTYQQTGTTLTFHFGAWFATGVLDGNTLTVRYDAYTQMADFEDAIYVLKE